VEGDEETVYAYGEAALVWIDLQKERPCPLPPALREAVERRLAQEARTQAESEA
jgi:acyl-CoA thioesterase FadM